MSYICHAEPSLPFLGERTELLDPNSAWSLRGFRIPSGSPVLFVDPIPVSPGEATSERGQTYSRFRIPDLDRRHPGCERTLPRTPPWPQSPANLAQPVSLHRDGRVCEQRMRQVARPVVFG